MRCAAGARILKWLVEATLQQEGGWWDSQPGFRPFFFFFSPPERPSSPACSAGQRAAGVAAAVCVRRHRLDRPVVAGDCAYAAAENQILPL